MNFENYEKLKKMLGEMGIIIEDADKFPHPNDLLRLPPDLEKRISEMAREYAERILDPTSNISKEIRDNHLPRKIFDMMYEERKKLDPRLEQRERVGSAMIDALSKAFRDGEKVDILDTFDTMVVAYLAFFKSQLDSRRRMTLTPAMFSTLANKTTFFFAEELAKLGLVDYVGDFTKERLGKYNKDEGVKGKEDLK